MPKLKHQSNEQVPELDLSDEATVQELLNADVLKPQQDTETKAAETAIKELKPVKVTLTLSPAENAQLTRMASVKGIDVKEFLHTKIQELFLDSNVGQPLISGPSNLSAKQLSGKKITAPSFSRRAI